jgi:AraC-like DNA-binding protein
MNSGTLHQAIEVLERYSLLRTPLVAIRQQITGRECRVIFSEPYPLGEIRRPVLEAVVLSVKNVVDAVSMGSHPVTGVMFSFAKPDYAPLAAEMFKCDVAYDQAWTGFSLPAETIDTPLKGTDRNTYREAVMICQRELEKIIQDESLVQRVRRVLLERCDAFPSLNLTARLFNTTPRTLHRNLLEEGTSYRGILENVRHSLAVEHLKSGRLSIQEIAFALGYTDLANFRRAFKRWEGVAPSDFRGGLEAQYSAKDAVTRKQ